MENNNISDVTPKFIHHAIHNFSSYDLSQHKEFALAYCLDQRVTTNLQKKYHQISIRNSWSRIVE